jgi:hypothetical protein
MNTVASHDNLGYTEQHLVGHQTLFCCVIISADSSHLHNKSHN